MREMTERAGTEEREKDSENLGGRKRLRRVGNN